MNYRYIAALSVFLLGCTEPISDAQVVAVAKACAERGMAVHIFNGGTSWAKCVPVEVKK